MAVRSARRRRTQGERRAETRRKVLDAAAAVFAERGYHGASLDDIADRAGLSKGSVYYNFASKQEFFVAVLRDRIGTRLDEVRKTLAMGATRERGAELAGTSFLERAGDDPRWGALFFEFLAHASRDDAARRDFARWLLDTRAALETLIARQLESSGIRAEAPSRELAIVVSALANGMLIERMFDPDGVPANMLGRALALLAAGLAAPPTRSHNPGIDGA